MSWCQYIKTENALELFMIKAIINYAIFVLVRSLRYSVLHSCVEKPLRIFRLNQINQSTIFGDNTGDRLWERSSFYGLFLIDTRPLQFVIITSSRFVIWEHTIGNVITSLIRPRWWNSGGNGPFKLVILATAFGHSIGYCKWWRIFRQASQESHITSFG